MKLLMFLLISLSLISIKNIDTRDDYIDEFYNACDEEYSYYKVIAQEETTDYNYYVVQGLVNNVSCYGICYINNTNDYIFNISYGGTRYRFNHYDKNNNSYCVAIKSEEPIKAFISDNKGNEKELFALKVFFTNQFDKSDAIEGNGNISKFNDFSLMKQKSKVIIYVTYISIITIGLFLVGIVIIVIVNKIKNKKEHEKIGNVNMKELYEKESTSHVSDDYFVDMEDIKNHYKKEEVNEPKEIVSNNKIGDIKEYLKNEGFITDYRILSEDEKNQIMVKLMILKEEKKITDDEYYKETKELWKK